MFPAQMKGIQRKSAEEQTRERILSKIAEAEKADEIKKAIKSFDKTGEIDVSIFEKVDNINATESVVVTSFNVDDTMSEAEFLDRFDVPVVGEAEYKAKGRKKSFITFFVHVMTLIGGLTVLGTSIFKSVPAALILVISLFLAIGLYCLLYYAPKTVASATAGVITVIFVGALVSVMQNFGTFIFGKCSFFAAFITTTALLFIVMVAYFLISSNKAKKAVNGYEK